MRIAGWALPALLFAALAVATGCSSGTVEIEDMGKLSGTVTHGGKPLPYGAVKFYRGPTVVCVAAIEKDGTYQTLLAQGDYLVAIDTAMEPRDIAKAVKEGPQEMVGAIGGRLPVRKKFDEAGKEVTGAADPYSRLPTLEAFLQKLSPAERTSLEAVQKRYGKAEESGLKLTVKRGAQTPNFSLD